MVLELSAVVSHLAAFLAGTATGAAGKYMADRMTDQRRRQEADSAASADYRSVAARMPGLLSEMREDLRSNPTVREFVILSSDRIQYTHDRPRLEFYETDHPDVRNQAALICEAGYAEDITTSETPKFRLKEHFVARLLG